MGSLKRFLTDLLQLAGVHRRTLLRLLAAGAAGMVVVSGAGFYFSSQPWFCKSCHYMKPYYRNWKESKHNFVACPKCHFSHEPVKLLKQKTHAMASTIRYVVGTYDRRPRAEVGDEMCLQSGCHDTRLLEGKGKATFKRGIIFDHKDHLTKERRGIKLRCTSCHSQIVQGSHISVTESVCFACHFRNTPDGHPLGGCGNCHGAPKGTVTRNGFTFDHAKYVEQGAPCEKCHVSVTRGTGAVPPDRCYSCHMERDRQNYDKATIHDTHVTEHKVECFECHEPITHGLVELAKGLGGTCADCHRRQETILAGTGTPLVSDSPSTMFLAKVSCEGCHHDPGTKHPGDVDPAAIRKACADCHGKGYDKVLDEWQATANTASAQTAELLARVEAAVKAATGMPDDARKNAEQTIASVRDALVMLDHGGAVHNIEYAMKVYGAARGDLDGILKQLNASASPSASMLTENDELRSCVKTCHLGLAARPTVSFEGSDVPHERHAQKGVPCKTCHSNEPDHGRIIIAEQDCTSCHHKSEQACTTCHTLQAAMLAGKGAALPTTVAAAGPMSADVPCEACHTEKAAKDAAPRAVAEACDACHAKGTGKVMLALWQGTTRKLHEAGIAGLDQAVKTPPKLGEGERGVRTASSAVAAARTRLDAVRRDGSWGVHNKTMVDVLLQEADRLLDATTQQTPTKETPNE